MVTTCNGTKKHKRNYILWLKKGLVLFPHLFVLPSAPYCPQLKGSVEITRFWNLKPFRVEEGFAKHLQQACVHAPHLPEVQDCSSLPLFLLPYFRVSGALAPRCPPLRLWSLLQDICKRGRTSWEDWQHCGATVQDVSVLKISSSPPLPFQSCLRSSGQLSVLEVFFAWTHARSKVQGPCRALISSATSWSSASSSSSHLDSYLKCANLHFNSISFFCPQQRCRACCWEPYEGE